MAPKKLSPAEKTKIALSAIVGDVRKKSPKDIGIQFGVSANIVKALRTQAVDAIQQYFYGVQEQIPLSPAAGLSDEEVSARLDKLIGTNVSSSSSLPPATPPTASASISATDEKREDEELIPVEEIVTAIQEYNNATKTEKKIYISRAVVAEVSPHPTKEIDGYFMENKAQIDAHNEKHELKRNTNRGLKGQDWISWLNLYEQEEK